MISKEAVLAILQNLKAELQEKYGVKEIGVFGSVVRGDATEDSDIDILVEFSRPIGFFKFLELEEYLQSHLGRKVDLVSKNALKPRIGSSVLRELLTP